MQKVFDFPSKIDTIQCLRFFAAIAVAFSHFGIVNAATDSAFNVTFFLRWFYTLSGFFVMLSTQKIEKRKGFLCRRIIRLVPLYWLLTLLVFAVAQFLPQLIGYTPNVEQLLKSMFFIPFSRETLKTGITIRPIVGLGHTLQMEMMFAVVFAIAMKISQKYRGVICAIFLIILAQAGIFFSFENVFCAFYLNKNYLALLSFATGILCYYFLLWMKTVPISNYVLLVISATVAVILLVMAHMAYEIIASSMLVCAIGFAAYVAIIACAVAYSSMNLPVPRFMRELGDASFSFYLIHYFFISVAERLLHIDSFSLRNVLLMIAVVVLSWGISYLSYRIIEKCFGDWLTKRVSQILMQ